MRDTHTRNPTPEAAFQSALEGPTDDDKSFEALEPLVKLAKALEQMRPRRLKLRSRRRAPRDQSIRS